jgi:hypothetical protein
MLRYWLEQLTKHLRSHNRCYPGDPDGWKAANDGIGKARDELDTMLNIRKPTGNDECIKIAMATLKRSDDYMQMF